MSLGQTFTTKRLTDFTRLEQFALTLIYDQVKNIPKDGQERIFKGEIIYTDNKIYELTCIFLLQAEFMSIIKLDIAQNGQTLYETVESKTQEIWLDDQGRMSHDERIH